MPSRFTKVQLHNMFIEDLGSRLDSHSDPASKVLLVDLKNPKRALKVYVFNCTCPPGGRALDEYKIQLIIDGQARGERGRFDDSDGRRILIVGYATPFSDENDGVYVIWDTDYHMEFAYSANLQCYLEPMLQSLSEDVVTCLKHGNGEKIVVAQRTNLAKAIEQRIEIDFMKLLEN